MSHNYIVRIYRHDMQYGVEKNTSDEAHLVGSVEAVESGEQSVFHDFNELWSFFYRNIQDE